MTRFADLAALAEALAAEGGRLKKRAAIAEALAVAAQASVEDAGLFCLYLAGQPFPEADPRKLNAGGALLTKALKAVSGCTETALTAAYRRHGDLGAAAFDLLGGRTSGAEADHAQRLSLPEISEAFHAMAIARTTAVRAGLVEGLLRRATALEAKYLLKLMLGDMRIGVKQSLVEEAIALAATSFGASADVAAVRHAVMLEADLSRAVGMAFSGTLSEARMRLFHPLGFMLASPVETPEEAVERFTERPVKTVPKKSQGKQKKKESIAVNDDAGLEAEADAMGATALPPALKSGIEQLSGESMGGVRVHMNSREPAGLKVGANTQGLQIHPAPAQENQLPHEAWHIVRQAEAASPRIHAFLEDKYDGMRAQVHCGDPAQPGRVTIYSRNREDITESFPEIEEAFREVREPVSGSLILDGELLGWDLEGEGKALPFSVLGQRIGRKRVDNAMRRQIPVVFMAFDLLFEAGELLLPLPLRERRARLEAVVGRVAGVTVSPIELDEQAALAQRGLFAEAEKAKAQPVARLLLSPAKLVESAEAIDRAYADARARANEGVMLKAAGSAYLPGRRGLAWVKLKRELATLDVVITGAEFGHGRRAGLLSDYTFAVRGADGELLNVGKAYSGVTDAEIAELTEWLQAHTLEDHGHFRSVEPLRVIEVAFNNVMRSERHASGFALRFPRILRIRNDKPLDEIDTLARVEEIYQSQPDKGAE
jgi:DNA ligase-1